MKLPLPLSSFLVIAAALAYAAAADDLAALKATLQALCGVNNAGTFGTCCDDNNDGQNIQEISALPSCFGSVSTTESGAIQRLFVSNVARSFGCVLKIIPAPSIARS